MKSFVVFLACVALVSFAGVFIADINRSSAAASAATTTSASQNQTIANNARKIDSLTRRVNDLEVRFLAFSGEASLHISELYAVVEMLKAVEGEGSAGALAEVVEETSNDESGGSYRGVRIAPENRCSPYVQEHYSYSQSVEPQIVVEMGLGGRIYSPYTGQFFFSLSETDIEHIVARSEAHDSGLCAESITTRRAFANDLANLTLASPEVNRNHKRANDLAEWLPVQNTCWYVERVLAVKRKYRLSMDPEEARVARDVIDTCITTNMQVPSGTVISGHAQGESASVCESDPLGCYDDNGNGRITCAEARNHGIAPVPDTHPAYKYMRDANNNGMVCE